ncbi:nucleotidyltransferase family protein [Mycobacterium sp. KBS0706]|uniref:nucleotidyltransferase family protein n=1 Tax=Mycobacterium sp. KBS0706 TaxID=2578109 RepID=UPI00163DD2A1|nr:nucleotidyltransferase family protein [Mycobacterium sp. KBS0706]
MSRTPLESLISALRGAPPVDADWFSVFEVANRSWMTPALFVALRDCGGLPALPADAGDYLAFIHERNRQRNLLLRGQLVEVIAALNRSGIQPILLKGAGIIFTAVERDLGARMMSDLDLLVEEAEKPIADVVLAELGYLAAEGQHGVWRPQDAGMLELHGGGAVSAAYGSSIMDAANFSPATYDAARARLPSSTLRALNLIVHDQIKEGDYWRGTLDLRHLHDLAQLAQMPQGIDWLRLAQVMRGRLQRNAFETQLLTLRELFEVPIPDGLCRRLVPRGQHWRRMVQIRHPRLAMPLRFAGAVAWLGRRVRTKTGPRFTATDLVPRVLRKLTQGRREVAEALMGVHLGPKL